MGKLVRPLPEVGYAQPLATNNSTFTHLNVTINASDQPLFDPNRITVAPNTNITFIVHNTGIYNHTFTLSRQPSQPGSPVPDPRFSPLQVYQFFNQFGSYVNLSLLPNAVGFGNVTITTALAGASLEFVSVVPYQFQAGMAGFLNVTRPLGPGVQLSENASSSSSGALSFIPDLLAVNATVYPVTVDVAVYDIGSFPHTWTVVPQPNVTLTPGNFTAYFQAHPPLADVHVNQPGVAVWGNFSVNQPGAYMYICTIAGHFAAGMSGFLYVGVPPPNVTGAPAESTAIVQAGVLVGGAALLGFGLLLAAVGMFSGRFAKSAPASKEH